jgi:hypothetical protein
MRGAVTGKEGGWTHHGRNPFKKNPSTLLILALCLKERLEFPQKQRCAKRFYPLGGRPRLCGSRNLRSASNLTAQKKITYYLGKIVNSRHSAD